MFQNQAHAAARGTAGRAGRRPRRAPWSPRSVLTSPTPTAARLANVSLIDRNTCIVALSRQVYR